MIAKDINFCPHVDAYRLIGPAGTGIPPDTAPQTRLLEAELIIGQSTGPCPRP